MKSRPQFSRGFTLIELLVVMTIIAILAGGIFAAAQAAIRKARGVQAQNMAVGLASAINNFRSDYGRWPLPTTPNIDYRGDSDKNEKIITILVGRSIDADTTKLNKRRRNFLDGLPIGKNDVGGMIYSGDTADLRDPWGQFFKVMIDTNNDGQISSPPVGALPPGDASTSLNLKVGVFSPGADKIFSGTNDDGQDGAKDNIRSW